ncbi:lmo0937 family membrane protein [Empedobacter stercoris]|uniref:Lmo0937 family membrane protein n=2 Tax=Empedobacter TaxID=59734 RepID=A0ABY8V7J5_9FLAO|nr:MULTISPECIES: lmo0937 family membrane protein [Empedobacter]MCA4776528.1 lmo0937 family membrane protein [Empedobacter stercoris]MCA4782521.1 lmo0937 family membrane protein [Empedobacter stercoris]MCA4808942.1 lmo0937 family membrane protein [Empedobacter stercoris]MDM1523254.1 lmo0937 family membrane protein [Empedobacter sp. 225-1]MDM1542501.1 lmo0937 family membrane protein [Empedobacter sp. 189-2]
MGNLVYTIAIILLILWAIGYFGFGEAVGSFIHILLVLAVIAILYRLITGRKP